ncbi:MAG: recombinase family protein [Clostridia bacterium]|nr:recombinase family protein [Clostridia bacterium]
MKLYYGKSCKSIARTLNEENIPTPSEYAISKGLKVAKRSCTWSDSRIKSIIRNEVYIGNMVQGRTKKVNYKSKKSIRLPESEWKIVKNTHDPIIEKNTFQRANEMLNIRKHTRVKSYDYLLKGLVYCHECGKKMNCSSRHLASGVKYYFRCNTNIQSKYPHCSPHSIRMDYVQNFVVDTIKAFIKKYGNLQELITLSKKCLTDYQNTDSSKNSIIDYKKSIHIIEDEIDKLYADKLKSHIAEDDYLRIYTSKKEKQNEIQKQILLLENINNLNTNQFTETITNKFNTNLEINKRILTSFIEKIEIDQFKKLYLYFKFRSI